MVVICGCPSYFCRKRWRARCQPWSVQTDAAIFFGATSFREQEGAYSEFAMVNKKSFTEMFRSATAERHSTLTCVMKEGRLHYYHNLENELFPS